MALDPRVQTQEPQAYLGFQQAERWLTKLRESTSSGWRKLDEVSRNLIGFLNELGEIAIVQNELERLLIQAGQEPRLRPLLRSISMAISAKHPLAGAPSRRLFKTVVSDLDLRSSDLISFTLEAASSLDPTYRESGRHVDIALKIRSLVRETINNWSESRRPIPEACFLYVFGTFLANSDIAVISSLLGNPNQIPFIPETFTNCGDAILNFSQYILERHCLEQPAPQSEVRRTPMDNSNLAPSPLDRARAVRESMALLSKYKEKFLVTAGQYERRIGVGCFYTSNALIESLYELAKEAGVLEVMHRLLEFKHGKPIEKFSEQYEMLIEAHARGTSLPREVADLIRLDVCEYFWIAHNRAISAVRDGHALELSDLDRLSDFLEASFTDPSVTGLFVQESDASMEKKHQYKGRVSDTPKSRQSAGPHAFEKIFSALAATTILGLCSFLIIRNQPFADQNLVVLMRILLSLAVSVFGITVPGILEVRLNVRGYVIRAGGALALFVVTYHFTPEVLPIGGAAPPKTPQEITGQHSELLRDIRDSHGKVYESQKARQAQRQLHSLIKDLEDSTHILSIRMSTVWLGNVDVTVSRYSGTTAEGSSKPLFIQSYTSGDLSAEWFYDNPELSPKKQPELFDEYLPHRLCKIPVQEAFQITHVGKYKDSFFPDNRNYDFFIVSPLMRFRRITGLTFEFFLESELARSIGAYPLTVCQLDYNEEKRIYEPVALTEFVVEHASSSNSGAPGVPADTAEVLRKTFGEADPFVKSIENTRFECYRVLLKPLHMYAIAIRRPTKLR